MIRAEFDVVGDDLDELMQVARKHADVLVGARSYTLDMDISQRTRPVDDLPASWVAEVQLRIGDTV